MRARAAPANVRRASDGLDELYQVSQAVLSVTRQMPVRDVLQVIVRSARSLVGARYAALGVPDEGDSFAEFVVDGISAAEWAAIGPLPRRHGMLAVLLNQGKPERLAGHPQRPEVRGLAGRAPEDVALPRGPGPRRRPGPRHHLRGQQGLRRRREARVHRT